MTPDGIAAAALEALVVRGLVAEADRPAARDTLLELVSAPLRICGLCGEPHAHGGKFCSDAHRAKWHREHTPAGIVKTIRKLTHGKVSVIVHYSPIEGAIALTFDVGDLVYMGD